MVGDVGLARQRDGDDVLGLVIVQRSKHEAVQGFDLLMRSAVGGAGALAGKLPPQVTSRRVTPSRRARGLNE